MTELNNKQQISRYELLAKNYGQILSLGEVAFLFSYPSTNAVIQAHKRKTLPVKLIKIKNRRGWFATLKAVTESLDKIDKESKVMD